MCVNWGAKLGQLSSQDGTSSTIMFNEVRVGVNSRDHRGTWALGFAGASVTMGVALADDHGYSLRPNEMSQRSDSIQDCFSIAGGTKAESESGVDLAEAGSDEFDQGMEDGQQDFEDGTGIDLPDDPFEPIVAPDCPQNVTTAQLEALRSMNENGMSCDWCDSWYPHEVRNRVNRSAQARSRHSGGVNACFSDGSVRFIRNDITPRVWWYMNSRNDDQIYNLLQYSD